MESALGILIIVAFVGFIGYHIWQDNKKDNVKVPAPKPSLHLRKKQVAEDLSLVAGRLT